ncbi:hypothetical protein DQG13_03705 [Paenibacillus sp. YN15]|nr:hypothetical protein DQG13_03705 [Paenibacillus sp. YN15]
MNDRKYTIGVDYGTESGRAILVDVRTGEELAVHVTPYPHGVIDEALPGSKVLIPHDWALQHPGDYLAKPEEVIGIGADLPPARCFR